MKTIMQALKDEVHYNLRSGFFENRLLERGLVGDDECTVDTMQSKPFKGAVADCLVALVTVPNIQEGDVSISFNDKSNLLKIANSIYQSIGEEDKVVHDEPQPMVYIGR